MTSAFVQCTSPRLAAGFSSVSISFNGVDFSEDAVMFGSMIQFNCLPLYQWSAWHQVTFLCTCIAEACLTELQISDTCDAYSQRLRRSRVDPERIGARLCLSSRQTRFSCTAGDE